VNSKLSESDFPNLRRVGTFAVRVACWMLRHTVNRKVGKALAALVLVSFLVHSILLFVWGRQLENRLAEIRAAGQPVYPVDLVVKIPDSENAAVIYEKAFAALKSIEKATPKPELPYQLLDIETPNAARTAIDSNARKAIELREPVIALVRQAVSRKRCVFPVHWEYGPGALFPHLARLREISRILAIKAVADASDNMMDAALDDVTLDLDSTRGLEQEPGLISYLVRIARTKVALSGLREATRRRHLSVTQARRMYEALGRVSLKGGYEHCLEGERAEANWCFDALRSGQNLLTSERLSVRRRAAVYLWRPISYKDQMASIGLIDKQLAAAKLSYREIVRMNPSGIERLGPAARLFVRVVFPELTEGKGEMSYPLLGGEFRVPQYAIVTHILTPVYSRAMASRDSSISAVGMGQVAMALKAYKSEYGSYPASLAELKNRLGWKLPDDPFSGKPFVYKRVGRGFLLYSLGSDLKDDGGRPIIPGQYEGNQSWVSDM
jgi:hypothetical protein